MLILCLTECYTGERWVRLNVFCKCPDIDFNPDRVTTGSIRQWLTKLSLIAIGRERTQKCFQKTHYWYLNFKSRNSSRLNKKFKYKQELQIKYKQRCIQIILFQYKYLFDWRSHKTQVAQQLAQKNTPSVVKCHMMNHIRITTVSWLFAITEMTTQDTQAMLIQRVI